MSNWISSKLKAAQNILHQIDQQAVKSLLKNGSFRSEEPSVDAPAKSESGLSLKDQLKKKPVESNEYRGKLRRDHIFNGLNATASAPKPSPKSGPTLTDDDWTELLSAPKLTNSIASASGGNHANGLPLPQDLSKCSSRKQQGLSSGLLMSDVKGNTSSGNSGLRSLQKSDSVKEVKLGGKVSDDEKGSTSSTSMERNSFIELQSDGKWSKGTEYADKDSSDKLVVEEKGNKENKQYFNYRDISSPELLLEDDKTHSAETLSAWASMRTKKLKLWKMLTALN